MASNSHTTFFKLEKSPARTWQEWLFGVWGNVALVVLAGLLGALLFPPHEVWWAGWFAICPLLIALRRTRRWAASGWLMLLFGLVFFAATLPWIRQIFGVSALGVYLLMALPMVPFGIIYRLLGDRQASWATVLLAVLLWVALDWVRCEGWYFQFSWAQLGFAFVACGKRGVLYSNLGVYGATMLLVLINAVVSEILLRKQTWRACSTQLVTFALLVLALSLYFNKPVESRLLPGGEIQRAVYMNPPTVALVQSEMGSFAGLCARTRALKPEHPSVVVWPEYAIMDYPLSQPDILRKLSALAREMDATLVIGCKRHLPVTTQCDWLRRRGMMLADGELYGNIALVIDPHGTVIGVYQKTHPIQFFADGVPGTRFPTFATPVARLGVAICYDFDFAATARRLTQHGAQLLVVPTFDADNWGALQHLQHARIAQARAAEVGRWVVRATSSGVSQIIAPDGANAVTITSGLLVTATAVVTPSDEMTVYMRYTHYLPQMAMILLLLWMVGAGIHQWRSQKCQNLDSLD